MNALQGQTTAVWGRGCKGILAWTASGLLGGAMVGWLLGLAYGGVETLLLPDCNHIRGVGAYFSLCAAVTGGLLLGFLRWADPEGIATLMPGWRQESELTAPSFQAHHRRSYSPKQRPWSLPHAHRQSHLLN